MENRAESPRTEGATGSEGVKQFLGPSRMVFTSFASSKEKEEMLRQVPGRCLTQVSACSIVLPSP